MKKLTHKGFVLVILTVLSVPTCALAFDLRADERVSTAASDNLVDDIYLAGSTVTSAASVQGDVAAVGATVIIKGGVTQDITAAGGTITVLSDAGDDLHLVGGTIIVQGNVADDAVVAGGDITMEGVVGGDVAVAGGTIALNAQVGGKARVAGGKVIIDAPIGGDVEIWGEDIELGPNANIGGSFTYHSEKEAKIDEAAIIAGESSFDKKEIPVSNSGISKGSIAAFLSLALLAKLLMTLVGAFALYFFFPKYSRQLASNAGEKWLASLTVGVIFLIVIPFVSIFLLLTIIGLPLGAIALLGYALSLIFASIAAPVVVGSVITKWVRKGGYEVTAKTVLIGVLVYFALMFVPILGSLVKFAAYLITLGALLSVKWGIAKEWR